MYNFIFYLFSLLLVGGAFLVITARNPVYAVLSLIFCFFNATALFILLGAEFVAMTLVIVYVGAVAVLFLFVVMMLNIKASTIKQNFLRVFPIGLLLSILVFISIFSIYNSQPLAEKGIAIISTVTNTEAIGLELYTNYFLAFQITGMILLVAMIGAIVLTMLHSKTTKRQNISKQLLRTREEGVELVEVESGKGVKI